MAKDIETLPLELQGGANLTKVKKDAKKIWDAYAKTDAEIAALRAQQSERRESLKAMGIPKSAFAQSRARANMDEEKRREHDFGVQVLGEAVGMQIDLFSSADERSDANPKSEPRKESAKKAPAKKAAPKKATGPKIIKNSATKKTGVAKGEGVDLAGTSRPLTGLEDAIKEADEKAASGKLN
jgi:hypothetical protein